MLVVEINDFMALIDNKPFFYQRVKNKQEAYEELAKMSRSDNYTTANLHTYRYRFIKANKVFLKILLLYEN